MNKILNTLKVAVLLAPGAVFAQVPTTPNPDFGTKPGLDSVVEANNLFVSYVGYAVNLFWVMTVLFGIFAAFKYLTAKGDPKAADGAKQMVIYTVIAACVALLATVVKQIALSILGG
ncbi:hypothetical protein KBB41_02320 [Candidatus Curtissbacteria bacterium]|nr:hypothetical protein [Candidatus Curtissbacteria bacterium]